MADRESVPGGGPWQRGGVNIEELPDPFARPGIQQASPTPLRGKGGRRRLWRWGSTALFAAFLLTILWLVFTAPLGRALEPLPNPAMLLMSADGKAIARRGAIKDRPVTLADLNRFTPAAFVAIEDRRFYRHWGIDPRAIGRALLADLHAGGVRQGGSTLTQQLAKTSFLNGDRSMKRKAQEMIIAFWLEAWLTKQEILSRYLSSVYFGDGVYGLRAAARHYFGVAPKQLTLAQSAMLAGLVQAPSRLAPTRNLPAAQKRSRLVLRAMADTGVISAARAAATTPARPIAVLDRVPTGTFFADWVTPAAADAFEADFGQVRVPTTLDSRLQQLAVRAVSLAALPAGTQAALVAMRPDGRVVAMVGGRAYKTSPFNRATQAKRQPGSAFKLFVYLAAMRAGWRPDSIISDAPITVEGWSPANSDRINRGRITLKEAFARSSNAATVRLSEAVGRGNVQRTARDLGITSPLPPGPSVALGTGGVSLLELTSAYAAVASGRYPVAVTGLQQRVSGREEDNGLAALFRGRGGRLDRTREWKPMLDLLWAAANEGTGRRAALAIPTFGKTGTSQDNRDALFVGFAGDLVIGVWVGRDDNLPMGRTVSGGTAPAALWRSFAVPALAIDGRVATRLPADYQVPRRIPPPPPRNASPIPGDWTVDPQWVVDRAQELSNAIDELDR
jgi:penicillin-binding protein 1A